MNCQNCGNRCACMEWAWEEGVEIEYCCKCRIEMELPIVCCYCEPRVIERTKTLSRMIELHKFMS